MNLIFLLLQLLYYLEDDTLSLLEPRRHNSGLDQVKIYVGLNSWFKKLVGLKGWFQEISWIEPGQNLCWLQITSWFEWMVSRNILDWTMSTSMLVKKNSWFKCMVSRNIRDWTRSTLVSKICFQ